MCPIQRVRIASRKPRSIGKPEAEPITASRPHRGQRAVTPSLFTTSVYSVMAPATNVSRRLKQPHLSLRASKFLWSIEWACARTTSSSAIPVGGSLGLGRNMDGFTHPLCHLYHGAASPTRVLQPLRSPNPKPRLSPKAQEGRLWFFRQSPLTVISVSTSSEGFRIARWRVRQVELDSKACCNVIQCGFDPCQILCKLTS